MFYWFIMGLLASTFVCQFLLLLTCLYSYQKHVTVKKAHHKLLFEPALRKSEPERDFHGFSRRDGSSLLWKLPKWAWKLPNGLQFAGWK